ncbi:hypothetical protein UFOVP130_38 [uncultured Caudovirales phage]|uniref:Uncharacterized protein n=1 Tax=uncultured Caudovirales phage TaxID=2100421 RepID=A0A6J5L844_9CAUD|nr:hypothetical protein UFOVP130_38 [uncultured Caudovirales phage]
MSLLVDDDFVTLADMAAIDPEVSDVADAEEITVVGDGGIVRQAWNECADALLEAMQSFGGDIIAWPGSITSYGAFGVSRPRLRLNQIVVSPVYGRRESTLKRLMIYQAIVLFYRAAANRRANDRYETKYKRFAADLATLWYRLRATGLPMVAIPLAAPGALHDYYAGNWGFSNLMFVAGGSAAQAMYNVAITWVGQTSGYVSPLNKNNAESGPSAILTATIPDSNLLKVSINGLNPPSTAQQPNRGISEGPYVTKQATGWNIYVGDFADPNGAMYLQNSTPIPVGTLSYTLPASPVLSGSLMQPGQVPDSNYAFQKILQRG